MISWHIDTLSGGDVETTSTATGCHWANPKFGGLSGKDVTELCFQGMCVLHGPTWTKHIACCLPNMAGWQIGEIRPPGRLHPTSMWYDGRYDGHQWTSHRLQLLIAVSARFPLSLFQRGWQPGTSSQCEQRQHLCECGNSGGLMMEIVRSCASLVIQMLWKMIGYSQVQTSNLQWKSHK